MKSSKRKTNKEKIFSTIITFAIILTLGYGIYSVAVNSRSKDNDNNIVDLNELNGDVALKTQETTKSVDEENNEKKAAEAANAGASKADDKRKAAGKEDSGISKEQKETSVNESQEESKKAAQAAAPAKKDPLSEYSFDDNTTLCWPVKGDIVLKYSMDSTIYFKTLGQYKCNPAIYISAQQGTNVAAAADGIVQSIEKNEETGTTLKVAVGNGYVTTYGMLDDVVFKQGDKITKGQLIGKVAAPTAYYSEEGPNVYFKLTKDDAPVDPTGMFE